ncbi:addiction module protein [Salinimicrobium sp. GXAS 041]|uniref:addiction module protein n=1 Tax=Salinimicrobium sp. GXAS 041 TaxID=3400806 RepID=UPI003C708E64
MDLNQLKVELIQNIISCENEIILREIEQILDENPSGVREDGEKYFFKENSGSVNRISNDEEFQSFSISEEQEEELMRRYRNHLEGRGKSIPWDEVKKNIREEHGF